MTSHLLAPDAARAERAAFLRGIEPVGLVLARAQCGDNQRAQAAIVATKAGFAALVAEEDPAQWQVLYWQDLLAQPALRGELKADSRNPFSSLREGPRAVLLLRLVAGLDELQGAQVLQVPAATYRHALFAALETMRANGIDEAALHQMRDSLQRDARPAHATAVPPVVDAGAAQPADSIAAIRRLRPWLTALAGLMLLVLVVSFFWLPPALRPNQASVDGFQTLRSRAPAGTLTAAQAAIADADFDLLNDSDGARVASNLDLYAWYAATANGAASPANATAALPETTLPETAAPDADAEDPQEGTDSANPSALPVVPGHALAGHPSPASSKADDHAH